MWKLRPENQQKRHYWFSKFASPITLAISSHSSTYWIGYGCFASISIAEAGDKLINELRVTSCELMFLRVAFIARVTSYFFYTSFELLFIARAMSYFYCTSYELSFIVPVKSYCLLHESRVTAYNTSYELLFAY